MEIDGEADKGEEEVPMILPSRPFLLWLLGDRAIGFRSAFGGRLDRGVGG